MKQCLTKKVFYFPFLDHKLSFNSAPKKTYITHHENLNYGSPSVQRTMYKVIYTVRHMYKLIQELDGTGKQSS